MNTKIVRVIEVLSVDLNIVNNTQNNIQILIAIYQPRYEYDVQLRKKSLETL